MGWPILWQTPSERMKMLPPSLLPTKQQLWEEDASLPLVQENRGWNSLACFGSYIQPKANHLAIMRFCIHWSSMGTWGPKLWDQSHFNLAISFLGLPSHGTMDWMAYATEIISHCAAGSEGQGVDRVGFFGDLSLWLVDSYLFPVSLYNLPSVCICVLIFSSYKDTRHIRAHSCDLILSYLLNTLSPNIVTLWGTEN